MVLNWFQNMRMKNKLMLAILSIISVSLFMIMSVVIYSIQDKGEQDIKNNKVEELDRVKQSLINYVDIAYETIIANYQNSVNRQLLANKYGQRLKNIIAIAGSIIENRKALEKEEFYLCYQPQVNIETGQLIGMEALVYWRRSDTREIITPGEFIPLAEETGLILSLGELVLRAVCSQNKSWQNEGFRPLPIAVNFSTRQFQQGNLIKTIDQILTETELEPCFLKIELTESLLMSNVDENISLLYQLKEKGLKISIDDFGTGYSSLSYLKRFPIDKLKIDRSFVSELTTNSDDASIAKAVIAMGHSLNMQVIAEGVETLGQLQLLRDNHCIEAQGYFFSPSVEKETFSEFMRQGEFLLQ